MTTAIVILAITSIILFFWTVVSVSDRNDACKLSSQWQARFEMGEVKLKEVREEKKLAECRITALEDAIKEHMHAKGHNRCWLNDLELYQVVNPNPDKMKLALPCLPEFMHNCAVYWRDSQPPEARNLGG